MPVLNVLGISRSAVAGRPRLTLSSALVTELALTLYDPDLISLQATLIDTRSQSWLDALNGAGEAAFTIQNDDPDVALVLQKKLVNFAYRDIVFLTMIVEGLDRTQISQDEESGELTVVSGRGHLALLEKALVYPTLGPDNLPVEQDRHFNWTSPFYDDTGWIQATEVDDVADAKINWPVPWNADYPDDTAFIIWASDGTITGAGAGHCYFRLVINVGISIPARVYLTGDNSAQLYIDGQIMAAVDFNAVAVSPDFPLSAGLHMVAVQCENVAPGGPGNPAGVAWTIYGVDAAGALTGIVANSSSAMKIVEYAAEPPGVTVGWAMGQVLDQFQARGILTTLTRTFDDFSDSYGEPWPVLADIGTTVGIDVLAFFIELAQTYIDFWMTPGVFELNAVNTDSRGTI